MKENSSEKLATAARRRVIREVIWFEEGILGQVC
jgi:hypothetical protein